MQEIAQYVADAGMYGVFVEWGIFGILLCLVVSQVRKMGWFKSLDEKTPALPLTPVLAALLGVVYAFTLMPDVSVELMQAAVKGMELSDGSKKQIIDSVNYGKIGTLVYGVIFGLGAIGAHGTFRATKKKVQKSGPSKK